MYQSPVVKEFLAPVEVKDVTTKDQKISEILEEIQDQEGPPPVHKYAFEHTADPKRDLYSYLSIGVFVFFVLAVVFSLYQGMEPDGSKWRASAIFLAPFAVVSYFGMMLNEDAATVAKQNSTRRNVFDSQMANLFNLLSAKPYEIRVKSEIKDDKWVTKIVVESNLVKEGGHVIKDKTQHFTSYINPLADSKTIVAHLVEIVQKAETQFR